VRHTRNDAELISGHLDPRSLTYHRVQSACSGYVTKYVVDAKPLIELTLGSFWFAWAVQLASCLGIHG
jgi:hypothetical protein